MTEEVLAPQVQMHYVHMDEHGNVTELCNPITRSWAKLAPPFHMDPYNGMTMLATLQQDFHKFCDDAWTAPVRRDPRLVNPYNILHGTEPVEVLDETINRLMQEHGPWYVADCAGKLVHSNLDRLAPGATK